MTDFADNAQYTFKKDNQQDIWEIQTQIQSSSSSTTTNFIQKSGKSTTYGSQDEFLNAFTKSKFIDFKSISKEYEAVILEKYLHSNLARKKQYQRSSTSILLKCQCGKQYKGGAAYSKHLIQKHNIMVESLLYLKMRSELIKNHLGTSNFQDDHESILQSLKNGKKHNRVKLLPQMMNIFSRGFQLKSKTQLNKLDLRKEQLVKNYYFNHYSIKIQDLKQVFSFSSDFLDHLRQIAISHIIRFQRNINIFLKNACIRDLIRLFCYNIAHFIIKTLIDKQFSIIIRLLQGAMNHFLEWIDLNFETVFLKHRVFYSHIQILPDQSYSQSERTYKIGILIHEYLLMAYKINQKVAYEAVQWFFQSFKVFVNESHLEV